MTYIYISGQNYMSSGWLTLYQSLEFTFGYSACSSRSSITQVLSQLPF